MNDSVLYNLTYGLYVIGAFKDGRPAGCVVNTCFQVTAQPPQLVVSMNKNNYTLEAIREHRRYSVSIIAEDTDPEIIGRFGFYSSRDTDKYEGRGYDVVAGAPCVRGKFAGVLVLEAQQFIDCGTHVLIVSSVVDTKEGSGTPMTYAYYHRVIKGSAPANAPTYRGPAVKAESKSASLNRYRCDICGYEVEVEGELPPDYECPLCGADVTHFVKVD